MRELLDREARDKTFYWDVSVNERILQPNRMTAPDAIHLHGDDITFDDSQFLRLRRTVWQLLDEPNLQRYFYETRHRLKLTSHPLLIERESRLIVADVVALGHRPLHRIALEIFTAGVTAMPVTRSVVLLLHNVMMELTSLGMAARLQRAIVDLAVEEFRCFWLKVSPPPPPPPHVLGD